jgi:hypothetical protein
VCYLFENKNPSKGYKVTLITTGCVNSKIEGSNTDSKTIEVNTGGGKAVIFIKPVIIHQEFNVEKISINF